VSVAAAFVRLVSLIGFSGRVSRITCNMLKGEVAERSKALDWNSSNIFTGVRGFESHPLRHFPAVVRAGSFAMMRRQPRQARKGAAVTDASCAEVRPVRAASTDPQAPTGIE
jgi:hypothetical protein